MQNPLFANYTLRKGDFIRRVLGNAGFNRVRISKCSGKTEWSTAKLFRQKYFAVQNLDKDTYAWTFDHPDHEHVILYQGGVIKGYAHIELKEGKKAVIHIMVIDESDSKKQEELKEQFLLLLNKWLGIRGYGKLELGRGVESYG